MVSIEFDAHALKDLEELESGVRKRIIEKIAWLQKNFTTIEQERLHYGLRNLYKLRIGDYRALYSVNQNIITIEIVGHRRDVYK